MKDPTEELLRIMKNIQSQLEGLSEEELEEVKPKMQNFRSSLEIIIDQIEIDTKMQQALVDGKITQQQYDEHKARASVFVKEILQGYFDEPL